MGDRERLAKTWREYTTEERVKKDFAEPAAFPGYGVDYRAWKVSIKRWEQNADYPEHKRADRVLRVLPWAI